MAISGGEVEATLRMKYLSDLQGQVQTDLTAVQARMDDLAAASKKLKMDPTVLPEFRDLNVAATQLAGKLGEANAAMKDLGGPTIAMKEDAAGLGTEMEKTAGSGYNVERMLERVAIRIVAVMAIRQALKFADDVLIDAQALTILAERTDHSVDSLDRLRAEAQYLQIPFKDVTTAVEAFDKKLEEGNPKAVNALHELGLSLKDLMAESPDKRLQDVEAAIARVGDTATKKKLELELFGTDGIAPLIDKFGNLKNAADSSLNVMGTDNISNLSHMKTAMDDLGNSVKESASSILIMAVGAIPVLGQVLVNLTIQQEARRMGIDAEVAAANKLVATDQELITRGQTLANIIKDQTVDTEDLTSADRALLQSLEDNNRLNAKNAEALGINAQKFQEYTREMRESKKTIDEFNKAAEALNSLGESYTETLAKMNPAEVKQLEHFIRAGATLTELKNYFLDLNEAQIKAAQTAVRESDKFAKAWEEGQAKTAALWAKEMEAENKAAEESDKLHLAALDRRAKLDETALEVRLAKGQISQKQELDQEISNLDYYARKKELLYRDESIRKENLITDALDKEIADLDKALNEEKIDYATYEEQLTAVTQTAEVQRSSIEEQYRQDKKNRELDLLEQLAKMRADANKKEEEAEKKHQEEMRKLRDMGSSFTYDLSTQAGVEQYRAMNPGMQVDWSDDQIIAFILKGGTLQQLFQMGIIHMKPFEAGGSTGEGGPAMTHPGEYVVPKGGALVMGGSGGFQVTIQSGAIQLNYPIMRDRIAQEEIGHLIGDALVQKLMSMGYRPNLAAR